MKFWTKEAEISEERIAIGTFFMALLVYGGMIISIIMF